MLSCNLLSTALGSSQCLLPQLLTHPRHRQLCMDVLIPKALVTESERFCFQLGL